MVAMMHMYNKSNTLSVNLYHVPLTLFADQECFDATFISPMDLYEATLNNNGGTIFERDINDEVLEDMMEKALFEVFLYEFK